jgi:GNAT superfamily N-acetyltransferase
VTREANEISVRRLEAGDLSALVELHHTCFSRAGERPRAEIEGKLAQLFFDGPLVDARLPSLVACDAGGRIVGFRGRVRRGWRLGGEPLLGSTTSHLMVRPELRRAGVSTTLRLASYRIEDEIGVRAAVGFADRATADGRAFSDAGSRSVFLEQFGFEWTLPFRPRALRALRMLEWRLPAGPWRRRLRQAWLAAMRSWPAPAPTAVAGIAHRSAPLSAQALQEAVAAVGENRLRIDESLEVWAWLLAYLADYPSRGRFSGRVVLDERGAPLGFFAGYANAAGGYEVLAFAARPQAVATVFGDVLREAETARAWLVSGGATVRELRTLLAQGAWLSAGSAAAVTTLRPDLLQRFQSQDVLITGLEGERWL